MIADPYIEVAKLDPPGAVVLAFKIVELHLQALYGDKKRKTGAWPSFGPLVKGDKRIDSHTKALFAKVLAQRNAAAHAGQGGFITPDDALVFRDLIQAVINGLKRAEGQ